MSFDHPAASPLHVLMESLITAALDSFSTADPRGLANLLNSSDVVQRIVSTVSQAYDKGVQAQNVGTAQRTLLPHLENILHKVESSLNSNIEVSKLINNRNNISSLCQRMTSHHQTLVWKEVPGQPSIQALKQQRKESPPTNVKSLKID